MIFLWFSYGFRNIMQPICCKTIFPHGCHVDPRWLFLWVFLRGHGQRLWREGCRGLVAPEHPVAPEGTRWSSTVDGKQGIISNLREAIERFRV